MSSAIHAYYSYAAVMLSNLRVLLGKTQIFSMGHSAWWSVPQPLSISHGSFPHGRKHQGKSPEYTSEPGVCVHNSSLDRVIYFLPALMQLQS